MSGAPELGARLAGDLRAAFRRRGHDAATAEDLAQETLLRAHAALPSLRDDERLDAFVGRVARSVHVDHLRARRAAPGLADEPADPAPDAADLDARGGVVDWRRRGDDCCD